MQAYNQNHYRNKELTGDWESIRRMTGSDNNISNSHKEWDKVYCMNGYKMTKEQEDAMYKDVYQPMIDAGNEIYRSNQRLLRAIKKIKGRTFHRHLITYLQDLTDNCYHREFMKYELVREPSGKMQKVDGCYGRAITHEWCEQWATGMEGDSWAGNVFIKIDCKRFLKVNFEM